MQHTWARQVVPLNRRRLRHIQAWIAHLRLSSPEHLAHRRDLTKVVIGAPEQLEEILPFGKLQLWKLITPQLQDRDIDMLVHPSTEILRRLQRFQRLQVDRNSLL